VSWGYLFGAQVLLVREVVLSKTAFTLFAVLFLICSYRAVADDEKPDAVPAKQTILSPSTPPGVIKFECALKTLSLGLSKGSMVFLLDDEKHTINGDAADIFSPTYLEFHVGNLIYKIDRPTGGLAVIVPGDDYLIGICKRSDQRKPEPEVGPEKK
jgi:hypothetical protein